MEEYYYYIYIYIYIYKTRLASNEIFSPSNKIHREVGRAKGLSAPLCFLFWYLLVSIVTDMSLDTKKIRQVHTNFVRIVFYMLTITNTASVQNYEALTGELNTNKSVLKQQIPNNTIKFDSILFIKGLPRQPNDR